MYIRDAIIWMFWGVYEIRILECIFFLLHAANDPSATEGDEVTSLQGPKLSKER